MLRQAGQAADLAGATVAQRAEIIRVVAAYLDQPGTDEALAIEDQVHRQLRALTDGDPYRDVRQASTGEALKWLPRLREILERADDPLSTAVRISAAGNAIDLAACAEYDLEATLRRSLEQPFAIDHLEELRGDLAQAEWVLMLGDNAGESVFDRLLVERLGKPVVYAVKGGAVINDVLLEDARQAGLDEVAELIETGADTVGVWLEACCAAFLERFWSAPLVIAKGQANFAAFKRPGIGLAQTAQWSGKQPKIYCLLQVKCVTVGDEAGVLPGNAVLLKLGGGFEEKHDGIGDI